MDSARDEARLTSRPYHWLSAIVLVAGITLSALAFFVVQDNERKDIDAAFNRAATDHLIAVRQGYERSVEVVQSLGALYAASDNVTREQFSAFTQHLLTIFPGIQALEWIPRVTAEGRTAHENAGKEAFPQYQITERKAQGQMERAVSRPEYFPVYYVEPYVGNEIALGFDLGSNPVRLAALNQSRDTGDITATAKITLVQERASQSGFLIFSPIYRSQAPLDTVQRRRANLLGFVLGVFRVGDVVEKALSYHAPGGIDSRLYDNSAPQGERFLYSHLSRAQEQRAEPNSLEALSGHELLKISTFDIAGRHYTLLLAPTRGRFLTHPSWTAWGILASALMLTALLALYLQIARKRALEQIATNEVLRESEENLRNLMIEQQSIIEHAGVGIAFLKNRQITRCNQVFATMFGYRIEELIGASTRELHVSEDTYEARGREAYPLVETGGSYATDTQHRRRDGTLFWASTILTAIDRGDLSKGVIWVVQDIDWRRHTEEALRLTSRAVESSANGVMITDCSVADNPITYVNAAFEGITGYAAHEVMGRNARFLVCEDRDQMGLEDIRTAVREQREGHAVLRNYRKDGSLFWNDLYIGPVRGESGTVSHFVGVMNDISEARSYQEQLEHQANYDTLTGLANRNLLQDRLRQALRNAHRHNHGVAIAFVDLDNFKFINDTLGHGAGDELLKIVAGRLRSCLRESDTVARLGGDEFVLVLPGQLNAKMISRVVQRIADSIAADPRVVEMLQRILGMVSQPTLIVGRELTTTCSIGVSLYPQDGQDAETLLKNADAAMYRAKELGRNNFQFYTAEINAKVTERLSLEGSLRRALEDEQFVLHYQPKLDLKSGSVSGVEALIRWNSPDMGLVPPARFIPILEETGLIIEVGKWVLRKAASTYQEWLTEALQPLRIAVNISALQLKQKNFVKHVEDAVREAGNSFSGLDLEITESLIMEDIEENIPKLKAVKEMGLGIAIDDFGTGYSSLSYLAKLPVDALKIDRAFIISMMSNADDLAIVSTVISLAHSLKLKVIAEGVETEEQARLLRLLKCDEMQGYLLSPPIPAERFKDWHKQFMTGQIKLESGS